MPATYQLRVDGHLDQHWSPWFGDLTLTQEDDGTTQPHRRHRRTRRSCTGCSTKIRDLGVTLISVALVDRPNRQ